MRTSPAPRSFYNTIGLQGDELAQATYRAGSQEAIVLEFFRRNRDTMFGPSEIHQRLFSPRIPLTSIRRAITNLTTAGYLRKTEAQTLGAYGQKEHYWYMPAPVVTSKPHQLSLFRS